MKVLARNCKETIPEVIADQDADVVAEPGRLFPGPKQLPMR